MPHVSPKNFSWLARLSSPPPSTSNSRQASTSRSSGSSATSWAGVAIARGGQHGDRVRRTVRPRHDPFADERAHDRPRPAPDHVEQVVDDRHQAIRRSPPEHLHELAPDVVRAPAEPADLRHGQHAIGNREHRRQVGTETLRHLRRDDLAGDGQQLRTFGLRHRRDERTDRRRVALPDRGAERVRRRHRPPPAGPRARACTGRDRRDGVRTTDTCSSTRPPPTAPGSRRHPRPRPTPSSRRRPPTRSGRRRVRRVASRREAEVAGARRGRGRRAAPGGRSRPRRGRSRPRPTRRARRARAETSFRGRPVATASASTPSRGSQPSAPRTAATLAAGAASASRCSARPSPEKPRQTSGLRTSVRRPPGTSSCQPVLPSPSTPNTRSPVAWRAARSNSRSRARPAKPRAPPPGSWCRIRRCTAVGREPHGPLRRRSRDRAQECARPRGIRLGGQRQLGLDDLDLEEAAQPSRGQRDLALDRGRVAGPDLDGGRPDRQAEPRSLLDRGERGPDPGSEVDVRRPPAERVAVVRLGQEVHASVDAAAGRERLEPEPVVGAGRDRVGKLEDVGEHRGRDVEP